MAKMKRNTPRAQKEITDKLDAMDDDDVIGLFETVAGYIESNFTKIEDEGDKNGGGSGESDGSGTTAIARFFGAE